MRAFKLIHPKFQLSVIFFGVLIGLISVVSIFLAQSYFFRRSSEALSASGLSSEHPLYYFLNQQKLLMFGILILVLVFSTLVSILLGYILSSRVAEPLKRMQEHFLSVSEGRMPCRLYLRKEDFFQEVVDAYNSELESRGQLPKQRKNLISLS
jgi:methyl-accepting chemotaxis protein